VNLPAAPGPALRHQALPRLPAKAGMSRAAVS